MIIGFTGTRQGPTPAQHVAMDRFLLSMFTLHGARVLVHGGAVGCDTFAHHAATPYAEVWIFPAEEGPNSSIVTVPMGNCLIAEPVPALMRNDIIAGLCDGLLAVPASDTEEQRSGTWATVRYARKRGCPVYIVKRDGSIVRDADVVAVERAKKVMHIRRARQTRDHRCHWPGCREMVPPAKWGCISHWRRLPKRIRDEIWRTYRIGQESDMRPSTDYLVIAREAQVWIRKEGDPL